MSRSAATGARGRFKLKASESTKCDSAGDEPGGEDVGNRGIGGRIMSGFELLSVLKS